MRKVFGEAGRHLLGPEPGELTSGRFFLDAVGDRLYFDTINPT
ncbi:hypothetical protein ACIRD8_06900 [Streptomyces sp. NPDC102451]